MPSTIENLADWPIVQHCSTIKERIAQKQHIDAKYLRHLFNEFQRELQLGQRKNDNKIMLANINCIVEALSMIKTKILTDFTLLQHTLYRLILCDSLRFILTKWQTSKENFDEEEIVFESIMQFLIKLTTQDSGDTHVSNVKFETIGNHLFQKESPLVDLIASYVSNITQFDAHSPNIARLAVLLDLLARYHQVKSTKNISNQPERYRRQLEKERKQQLSKEENVLKAVLGQIFSETYLNSFSRLPPDAVPSFLLINQSSASVSTSPMGTLNEFLLITCPKFTIGWSEKIPELFFTQQSLDSFAPLLQTHLLSLNKWSKAQVLSFAYLLKMIVRFVLVDHLEWNTQFIDQSLQILSDSRLQKAVKTSAHNSDTMLIDSALMIVFRSSNGKSSRIDSIKKANQITETLVTLSNARSHRIQLYCYSILAHTMTDEDLRALKAADRIVDAFARFFRDNIYQSRQTWDAIPLSVVLGSFKVFVQYDQIKTEIIRRNHLSWFVQYLNRDGLNVQIEQSLLEIIWSMTFDNRAAMILKDDADFLERIKFREQTITSQKKSTSSHASNARLRAIEGILWKLETESELLKEYYYMDEENVASEKEQQKASDDNERKRKFKYDVVLSYADQDKDLCQRLQSFLEHRQYRIWTETTDSTSMTRIVPIIHSTICMLVCMSNAYKQTTHCQAQAIFAASRSHCAIVPVIVQANYCPDGWLAKLIDNVERVDVTDGNFEQLDQRLKAEIKGSPEGTTPVSERTEHIKIKAPLIRRRYSQYKPNTPDPTEAQESFDDSIQELLQWTQTNDKIAHIVQELESTILMTLTDEQSPVPPDLRDLLIEIIELWNSNGLLRVDHQEWLHHCSNLLWLISSQISVPAMIFNGKLMHAMQIWIEDVSRRWDRYLNDENTRDMSKLILIAHRCRSETLLTTSIRRCVYSSYYVKAFHTIRLDETMRPGEEFILLICPQYFLNYHDNYQKKPISISSSSIDKILTKFLSGRRSNDLAVLSLAYFINILTMYSIQLDRSCTDHLLTLLSSNVNIDNQCQYSTFLVNSIIELLKTNHFDGTSSRTTLATSQIRALFEQFRHTREPDVRLYASAIVAHTMDERTVREYTDLKELLRLLMENLQQTIEEQDASMSISVEFLLDSLKALVQHDQVKTELCKSGQLSILVSCVTKSILPLAIVRKAIDILWSISFDPDAATILKNDSNLINILQTKSENKDGSVLATVSEDLLWQLQTDANHSMEENELTPAAESVDRPLPM